MTGGFVRAARAADAAGLARVQVASWRAAFAGLVPDAVIAELTSDEAVGKFAERWREAISAPPTSRHRVHVAVGPVGSQPTSLPGIQPSSMHGARDAAAGGTAEVVGFAAAGPATDEDLWPATDGELYELHVVPAAAGEGHDERLLHAVADTFAEDGFSTGYTWALAGDEPRIEFLEAAGWAPDGTRASLDMGVKVPTVRLHTRLSPVG
jgi:ribosomal protein S18 acetylase RimI-like enzyme